MGGMKSSPTKPLDLCTLPPDPLSPPTPDTPGILSLRTVACGSSASAPLVALAVALPATPTSAGGQMVYSKLAIEWIHAFSVNRPASSGSCGARQCATPASTACGTRCGTSPGV